MRLHWLAFAVLLAACASSEGLRRSNRLEADVVCTADTAVRCPLGGCALWQIGAVTRLPLAIEVPASVGDEGRTQMCVDGACSRVILDTEGQRGRSWSVYVVWSHGSESYQGPLQVYPGGRSFEARLDGGEFATTWRGRCTPGDLSSLPPLERR
ncbi:MAG TPA: hypothetical protein VJ748_01845 [Vitreimonas sp.]|jgi:hypothetical protein|nr:hypothetical protein [Vitreimonas sp.]